MTSENPKKLTPDIGSEDGDFLSWLESKVEARQKPIRELEQQIFNGISEIFELYHPPSSNLIHQHLEEEVSHWWSCIFIHLKDMCFLPLSRKFLNALEIEDAEYYYLRLVRQKTKSRNRNSGDLEHSDRYRLKIFVPSWKRYLPRKQRDEDISIEIGGFPYSTYVHFSDIHWIHLYPHVIHRLTHSDSKQEGLELVLDLIRSIKDSVVSGVEIAKLESVGFSRDNFQIPG